jgi:hypothetical protein
MLGMETAPCKRPLVELRAGRHEDEDDDDADEDGGGSEGGWRDGSEGSREGSGV